MDDESDKTVRHRRAPFYSLTSPRIMHSRVPEFQRVFFQKIQNARALAILRDSCVKVGHLDKEGQFAVAIDLRYALIFVKTVITGAHDARSAALGPANALRCTDKSLLFN